MLRGSFQDPHPPAPSPFLGEGLGVRVPRDISLKSAQGAVTAKSAAQILFGKYFRSLAVSKNRAID